MSAKLTMRIGAACETRQYGGELENNVMIPTQMVLPMGVSDQ